MAGENDVPQPEKFKFGWSANLSLKLNRKCGCFMRVPTKLNGTSFDMWQVLSIARCHSLISQLVINCWLTFFCFCKQKYMNILKTTELKFCTHCLRKLEQQLFCLDFLKKIHGHLYWDQWMIKCSIFEIKTSILRLELDPTSNYYGMPQCEFPTKVLEQKNLILHCFPVDLGEAFTKLTKPYLVFRITRIS